MLIIAALSIEIAPLLNVLSAKKVKAYSNKTALFHAGKHDLLITGVGPIMAKRTLVAYLDEYRPNFILNIGTAGMLNQELKLGEIYHIASVITENENEIALHLLTGEAGETCLSVRRCIEDSGLRDHSHKKHQARLADMECYAIAAIAKENNI
ncbi:MAG: hypothetical protein K9N05_07850, partial [Candidatus Marinimicrobia bacterium]|nr:hypothetical protein [Candidatus Neomarinimicrobiota bacterium]